MTNPKMNAEHGAAAPTPGTPNEDPPEQSGPQAELRTIVRTCAQCPETLTLTDGQPITERLAIEIGMWLTVIAETVVPEGIRMDAKYFCSTECLKHFIDAKHQEYVDAEDRVLAQMAQEKAQWDAAYAEAYPGNFPDAESGIILTDMVDHTPITSDPAFNIPTAAPPDPDNSWVPETAVL